MCPPTANSGLARAAAGTSARAAVASSIVIGFAVVMVSAPMFSR
jgi:hypothetical protein